MEVTGTILLLAILPKVLAGCGEREGTEGRGRHYIGVRRERVRLDKGYRKCRGGCDLECGAQRREGIHCQRQ